MARRQLQYKEIAPVSMGKYNDAPLFCVGKHDNGEYVCKVGDDPAPILFGSLVKFGYEGSFELIDRPFDKVEELLNS